MEKTIRKKTPSRYVGRAVLLSFGTGTVAVAVLMMISGGMLAAVQGTGTYDLSLGPLVFFRTTKEVLEGGGTTAQISPGFGIFVLLVVFPVIAGTVTYFIKKRAAAKAGN